MSEDRQDPERAAQAELMSADPRQRSAAAQLLISRLDLEEAHAPRFNKKESQLKHTYPTVARALKPLSSAELRRCFQQINDSARVSLLRALKALDAASLQRLEEREGLISQALSAATPKVRQGCAQLLSALPILTLSILREALWREEVYFVRSSLILAIGRRPELEARATLEEWSQHRADLGEALGAQEREALLKAQSALALHMGDAQRSLSLNAPLDRPLLWCAPLGLEAPLCAELSELGWRAPQLVTGLRGHPLERAGLVSALRPSSAQGAALLSAEPLSRPRCADGLALLLATRVGRADEAQVHRFSELLLLAERALNGPSELREESSRLSTPVTYRVELPSAPRGARRALRSRCRALMASLFSGSIESPSDYQVTLMPRFGGHDSLLLRLDALSSRQGYARVADVGASMSQTVAASVARHSRVTRERLQASVEGSYIVLDPTCGSGTLLLERALLDAPAGATYHGQDLSRVAHRASLDNLRALSLSRPELMGRVSFQQIDSAQAEWPWFDEALMNLPFGLRVTGARGQRASRGELEGLYEQLFRRASERAKPNATLTCYSARQALMERASQASGWRPLSAQSLWSGGLLVRLVSYQRP